MKYKIQVENSAPSQTQAAQSVSRASEILVANGVTRVVDLGCGRLRNLPALEEYFPEITVVDTALQCERIADFLPKKKGIKLLTITEFGKVRRKYEAIFLISVLHIIDKPGTRKALVKLAHEKLRSGGYLVTDVPTGEAYYRQKCTSENRHGDGWVMGTASIRTFYKNYSALEFDRLITSDTTFTLFRKISLNHHIVRIWKRHQ